MPNNQNGNYLIHYGVLGMKWGVRHDRKTGRTTIKKGTDVSRLTVRDESTAKGHAYVTFLNGDTEHYRGFFAARLKATRGKKTPVFSVKMTAKEDLVTPSQKERVDTFMEMYTKDKRIGKELGKYYKQDWRNFAILPSIFYQYKFSKLKGSAVVKKGYDCFKRSIGGNEYIRSEYFKTLSKKGFNFVIDDMDAGRFGKEPSIVFDREKSLDYKGQTEVSNKEIYSRLRKQGIYMKGAKGNG